MSPALSAIRTWFDRLAARAREPRFLLVWVVVCAGLLALRKPWALHTPQLWAEDGSIFLVQNEQMGLRAWWEPYNGYLHLLPRLIAWAASRIADVAWWPAIYNGAAFALHIGVLIRLASPRVALPAKAGFMLALVAVVGTGEPLLNVTNVQWVTAFYLLLHLFLAPPANGAQRVRDLALLAVVGLNGPFALVFLPLFAWRAWERRSRDAWFACAVLAACAGVQAKFMLQANLALEGGGAAFRPLMGLSIPGSRLVTWPFFGPAAVKAWPFAVHAALFVTAVAFTGWRTWRAGADRPMRAVLFAAFVLVTVACSIRVRADTWEDDNLVNGDRYFFISRVLLTWLLLLEWHAPARFVAWPVRAAFVLGVALHVPHYVIPAPPDYRWRQHCDPIRRGQPANIYTLPEGWWIEYPGRPKP